MSDTPTPAETLKLPTGKLGQPTTDTAIARATDAVIASKAIAENGPQITRAGADHVTPSATTETTAAAGQASINATAAPLIDLFRGSARLSAAQMQTVCDAWIGLARGARDIQVQWLDTIGSAASVAGVKPDLWQGQRDLYVQSLDRMFDATSRIISLATTSMTRETTH